MISDEGAQIESRGVPIGRAGVGVICARNKEQCSKEDENRRGLVFQNGDSETHEGWRVRCKEVDYNRAEVVVFGVGRQSAIVLVTWTTKDTKLHKGCPLRAFFVFLRALRG